MCFDAAPKRASREVPDYIGTPKDWEFIRRLSNLRGKPVPEIEREYKGKKHSMDKDAREYPYMDEFEYISTRECSYGRVVTWVIIHYNQLYCVKKNNSSERR